jgi:predicted KAP-like P-loop ATPase
MSNIREEFIYLNRLRESGETNMWGASPYLQEQFFISRKEASKILTEWMEWVRENPANRDA